jgi:hypothetical protein
LALSGGRELYRSSAASPCGRWRLGSLADGAAARRTPWQPFGSPRAFLMPCGAVWALKVGLARLVAADRW